VLAPPFYDLEEHALAQMPHSMHTRSLTGKSSRRHTCINLQASHHLQREVLRATENSIGKRKAGTEDVIDKSVLCNRAKGVTIGQ
jgi:hypothetical protein